jgi:LacI family transcriptional regulator
MPKEKIATRARVAKSEKPATLKKLADYLGLAPATVSLVLNGSAVAETIAPETRRQIHAAAKELNYRPNFFARCLRTHRSSTIGVMVPEVSQGYNATVLSGIEDQLLKEGYFYFVASHRFRQDLIDEYPDLFLYRSVDGLIVVNAPWQRRLDIPVVTVSSHHPVPGVTRISLNHRRAAELALGHLVELGHRNIAFIKGQSFVPDTEVCWAATAQVAAEMGLSISPKLVVQIEGNSPSHELGYKVTHKLMASGVPFSALMAFNDITAIGAIRALHEAGRRVPKDVSVVGFDDIESASYQNPPLTTVRQPLRKMGRMAAQTVLRRISGEAEDRPQIIVEPELVLRETTCAAARRK